MRTLVEELCSERCAGRAPGTREGREARGVVVDALRRAGLDPYEQDVSGCKGANVIATIPGDIDRWVLVGAHYDHLGRRGKTVYWGADDNAAAVGILVDVANSLSRKRPDGRGVMIVAFDGEEPPYFLTGAMGSERFASAPPVPLQQIDMMVCMDLVGHAFGPEGVPDEVRETVFALGAERSAGTAEHVDRLGDAVSSVRVRRADVEIVHPLSDYAPFWRRAVPFLFLTSGRSRYYHTPEDTPETLDWAKMAATSQWLDRFVRETCARPQEPFSFKNTPDDAATLRSIIALTSALAPASDEAAMGEKQAVRLLAECDSSGRLPESAKRQATLLLEMLESQLA